MEQELRASAECRRKLRKEKQKLEKREDEELADNKRSNVQWLNELLWSKVFASSSSSSTSIMSSFPELEPMDESSAEDDVKRRKHSKGRNPGDSQVKMMSSFDFQAFGVEHEKIYGVSGTCP